jgi:hypothetical protein
VRNHGIGDGLARDQAAVEVEVTSTVQVLDVRDGIIYRAIFRRRFIVQGPTNGHALIHVVRANAGIFLGNDRVLVRTMGQLALVIRQTTTL